MYAAAEPASARSLTRGFSHQSLPQRVVFGRGARLDVADELTALGCSRAIFLIGPRATGHPAAAEIRTALWPLLADEFHDVDPKLPTALVASFASRADSASADAIVAFGGGACIDVAKAGARAIAQMRRGSPGPVVVAIPSTLTGAEATGVPGTGARVVLYDPDVLARVGLSSVLASGACAISHAMESLYHRDDPLVESAASEALRQLSPALPKYRDDPNDLDAAAALLQGAYLAGFAMARSPMGLAHGICRTISARTAVPYAVAHAIVLPHVLRYNAATVGSRIAVGGRALGAAYHSEPDDDAAMKTAAAVERLVRALGLPGHLRETGIEEPALIPLAEAAMTNPCLASNPRPIESPGQVLMVLRAAF
jgi:maleylacetate reductase